MKKGIFFLCVLSVLSSCTFYSNEEPLLTAKSEEINQELAFSNFINDLSSLNNSLDCSNVYKTKGADRDLVHDLADAVGGALGNRFGKHIGAWAGSAAGPAGAVVGYVAGQKFGGVIGTIVASEVAAAIYDVYRQDLVLNERDVIPLNEQLDYYHNDIIIEDDSSYGYVHNVILANLRSNGKQYAAKDGTIKIEELYNDALCAAKEMNIVDDLSENEDYKAYMKDYFEQIAEITFQDVKGTATSSYASKVQDFLREEKNFTQIEAQNIMEVINATQVSASLDASQALEYEKQFEELVDNSSLSAENKNIIKVTGSVSIMSTNYWYAE